MTDVRTDPAANGIDDSLAFVDLLTFLKCTNGAAIREEVPGIDHS
jgi:hypothetical protein